VTAGLVPFEIMTPAAGDNEKNKKPKK